MNLSSPLAAASLVGRGRKAGEGAAVTAPTGSGGLADLMEGRGGFTDPDEVPRAVGAVQANVVTMGRTPVPRHQHLKAELIYTSRGVINCDVEGCLWIVPAQSAVWIPGGLPHSVFGEGEFESVCLFVDPEAMPAPPSRCCTIAMTPFLRELVSRASRLEPLYDDGGREGRLVSVFLDELAHASVENLHLPMPSDPRLLRLAALVRDDPADRATTEAWARRVAMSERSLCRQMIEEVGMSFGRWRRQLHVIIAVQRLADGLSVEAVASDLGYESASSFVVMFRKIMGVPPGRYTRSGRFRG